MANSTPVFTTMSWLEEPQSIGGRFAKDAFIGGIAAFSTALFRIGIETIVGGVAPFILTFPACMIATLAGSRRSVT